MGWFQAIVELFQLLKLVLGWWKETTDERSKAKQEVITQAMKDADNGDQEAIKRAINKFNSL